MLAARSTTSSASSTTTALLVALTLLFAATLPALAQFEPPRSRVQKAQMEVVADRSSYAPGETARLAAQVSIEDGWHLQSNTPSFDYLIPTELFVKAPQGFFPGDPVYPDHKMWQSDFETEPLAVYEGDMIILGTVAIPADAEKGPIEVSTTLAYQACDVSVCLPPTEVDRQLVLVVGDPGEPTYEDVFAAALSARDGGGSGARGPSVTSASGLALILGIGWLGGLILNLMPCVLPILSLKVFGLVQTAGQGRRHVTVSALATATGILVSFWALAALAIAARSAGEAVGWGIQFQNPVFVTFLAVVLVFFALNMWGLFEIPMPSFLASGGSGGHGFAGHFGTGLFATLMATPCSAPFLGTAVGFALSQPALVTLAVFTAVGVGMATPYLLLAATPGAARFLPKPGAWMTTLRGVMGFLLAGTVVWLMYVLAAQIAPASLALLQVSLLAIGLCAWLLRELQSSGKKVTAGLGIAACALLAMGIAERAPAAAAGGTSVVSKIDWVTFDETEAQRIASEGGMVFVDVTADWCATCKVNERLVLETDEVAGAFEEHEVVAMKADWTNRDDTIANYLASYGRYAIPFYALYRPGQDPHVFGELLSKKDVIRTLEASQQTASASTGN